MTDPVRAFVVLILLCGLALAGDPAERLFVVRVATERSTATGTSRTSLEAPALPVGPNGLLMAVGFHMNPPEEDRGAVKVTAFDPSGRERPALLLGGDEALRCTFFRLQDLGDGEAPEPVALDGVACAAGDPVVVIGRHGAVLRHARRRLRTTVEAVVKSPKPLYALEGSLLEWRSCIVATPEGGLVGFVDTRPTVQEGTGLMVGLGPQTVVVVPASEFADLARKPPEPEGPVRSRAWLGVNLAPFDTDRETYFGVEEAMSGALVTGVSPGSPADKAGIRLHDVISTLGPSPVRYESTDEWDSLLRTVQRLPLGEPLECKVVRFRPKEGGGFERRSITVTMVLAERPVDFQDAPESKIEPLGIHVKPITNNWRNANRLPEGVGGVVVNRIERGSPAQLAGLAPNDLVLSLDGKPTPDVETLRKLLDQARSERRARILLFLRRGTQTAFVPVTPGW